MSSKSVSDSFVKLRSLQNDTPEPPCSRCSRQLTPREITLHRADSGIRPRPRGSRIRLPSTEVRSREPSSEIRSREPSAEIRLENTARSTEDQGPAEVVSNVSIGDQNRGGNSGGANDDIIDQIIV